MGRLRPLAWGVATGLGSYGMMRWFAAAQLERLDAGLRALRHEINPDAPAAAPQPAPGAALAGYRQQAQEAFRDNWNSAIAWVYGKAVSGLRSPYLSTQQQKAVLDGADKAVKA
jgi:hypothetical protein